MKFSRVIIILLSLFFVEGKKSDQSKSVIAEAINGILETYFVNNSPKIDLVYFGNNRQNEKLVNDILRMKPSTILMDVSEGGSKFPWKNRLNVSSILLFESAQSFKKVVKDIEWLSNKEQRFAHLVYSPGISTSDIEESIKDGFSIDKVEFLMNETKHALDLVSSFMFTAEKCRSNQLQIINRFTRSNLTWESSNFYPKKYNNFHGCDINIAAGREADDLFDVDAKELYELIAKKLNFQPIFNTSLNTEIEQIDLYTEIESFNDIYDDEKDRNFTRFMLPYLLTVVVVVPPGEPYSTLEKMFLMFDLETWIAITVTLSVGLALIQIINLCSIKVQNLVYGKGITTPTMNMANIFLTGAQTRVPSQDFARYLFILFITWSLLIRTCYQSKLFTFLQADIRKPSPKTLEDLAKGLDIGEDYEDAMYINEKYARYKNFEFGDPERFVKVKHIVHLLIVNIYFSGKLFLTATTKPHMKCLNAWILCPNRQIKPSQLCLSKLCLGSRTGSSGQANHRLKF